MVKMNKNNGLLDLLNDVSIREFAFRVSVDSRFGECNAVPDIDSTQRFNDDANTI